MRSVGALLRRIAAPVHHRFRSKKGTYFLSLIRSGGGTTLLDVGGGTGMAGEFLPVYEAFKTVTIVNLIPPADVDANGMKVRIVKGDGRYLPFADNAFDWVFSNAVIEHVGDWSDQKKFAAEIRRVAAKGYFVTTPNKYFPIEPHALLPLYQFYPQWLKPLALRVSPGYMHGVENITLLSKRRLKLLFPEAEIKSFNLASSLAASHVRTRVRRPDRTVIDEGVRELVNAAAEDTMSSVEI